MSPADRPAPLTLLLDLEKTGFDAYGRVELSDRDNARALRDLLAQGDALAVFGRGCSRLYCDTALLRAEELVQMGAALLVDNADFAALIRKRKACETGAARLEARLYKEVAAA